MEVKKQDSGSGGLGLQLRLAMLPWREGESMSSLESAGEEGTFLKDLGESREGRISEPMTPLQMLVLASVGLPLKAAPERQEKLLVF